MLKITASRFMTTGLFFILLSVIPVAWASDVLQVNTHHLVLRPGPAGIIVHERIILNNPAIYPIKGIAFFLPEGYQNLSTASGEMREEKGQLLTGPVPSGVHNYSFSYTLDSAAAPNFRIAMRPQVPTEILVVLVPAGHVELMGSGLQNRGSINMGGIRYQVHVAESPVLGETVEVTAVLQSGSGQTATEPVLPKQGIRLRPATNFGQLYLLLLLALVFSPLGFLAYRHLKRQALSEISGSGKAEELKVREKILLGRIVDLDQKYNEGVYEGVNEEEYRRVREIYKQKLIKIKENLGNMSD